MPDYITLYRQSQGRILSLVNNGNVDTPVEACPGWSVRDTLAHLLGVLTDLSKGKIADSAQEGWADTHIARAGDRSVSDLNAEWHLRANTTPAVFQEYGAVLHADCLTHEFDIKQAIGNRQGRDLQAVRSVALFYLGAIDQAWRSDVIPPLRIVTESKSLDVGGDNPQVSVEMSWWEIGRVVSGRRSVSQVKSLTWSNDPTPWLDHLFVFGPRETPLEE